MAKANSDQKKAAALAALLESDTLTAAAEKAEISRKTLYNYIRYDLEFAKAYESLREQEAISALERMEQQRERASGVILSIMDDAEQPGAVRLKAAQAIMEAAAKQGAIVASLAADNVSKSSPDIFDLHFH